MCFKDHKFIRHLYLNFEDLEIDIRHRSLEKMFYTLNTLVNLTILHLNFEAVEIGNTFIIFLSE